MKGPNYGRGLAIIAAAVVLFPLLLVQLLSLLPK